MIERFGREYADLQQALPFQVSEFGESQTKEIMRIIGFSGYDHLHPFLS